MDARFCALYGGRCFSRQQEQFRKCNHRRHSPGDRRTSKPRSACFRLVATRPGGLIGVGSSAVLAYRAAPLRPLIAVDTAAFIALFAWTSVVGLRLWRGGSEGNQVGIALYALQIPSLEVHGLKYDYFTGVALLCFTTQVEVPWPSISVPTWR